MTVIYSQETLERNWNIYDIIPRDILSFHLHGVIDVIMMLIQCCFLLRICLIEHGEKT